MPKSVIRSLAVPSPIIDPPSRLVAVIGICVFTVLPAKAVPKLSTTELFAG